MVPCSLVVVVGFVDVVKRSDRCCYVVKLVENFSFKRASCYRGKVLLSGSMHRVRVVNAFDIKFNLTNYTHTHIFIIIFN